VRDDRVKRTLSLRERKEMARAALRATHPSPRRAQLARPLLFTDTLSFTTFTTHLLTTPFRGALSRYSLNQIETVKDHFSSHGDQRPNKRCRAKLPQRRRGRDEGSHS